MTPAASLPLSPAREIEWCCHPGVEEITIEYLGVGGWLMRMGESVLLTAPFFSNPGFLDAGLGRIEADTVAIEQFLPPVEDAMAILVGHAHYDHLMDIPYILRRRAPTALLYGSRTAVNLLHGDPDLDPGRLFSVEEVAGTREGPGEWVYLRGGRVRFMALRSGHAPHFMGIHLYEGEAEEPAAELPNRAGEWVEGLPLAFLIDFLSAEGEVLYRVHYQDAASEPPLGFPPEDFDGIPVDLAILCPPGYQELSEYPEGILSATSPTHVLLGHWEDFFTSRTEPLRGVRGTDLKEFIMRTENALPPGASWGILEPGVTVRIPGMEG
jgi:hypothetical protein